jgi:ubiquinone/menaquinone biosynthesis C-methylase UbiE
MTRRYDIIDGEKPVFPKGSYFDSAKTTLDVYDEILLSLVNSEHVLLDAGCGKKSMVQRYSKQFRYSVGMDVSPEAIAQNKGFSAFVVGDASRLPFQSGVFDVVVSQWMIEHIGKIDEVVAEFGRVLKRGGSLVVATNSKYHPMMFLSSILPTRLRDWMKVRIFPSYIDEDTFPTYYRFNSLGDIDRLMTKAGFERKYASYLGAPFFMFNKLLFRISECYERATDISFLRFMKMHVVVHYEKK